MSRVLSDLRLRFKGRVLLPAEKGYDDGRSIWNGAILRRPLLIARCLDVEDVQVAVETATKHGMPMSVRGGGYDWSGRSIRDDAMLVDLSEMRSVSVCVGSQTATFQGGATGFDLLQAAAPHGLMAVVGSVGGLGMAGFTMGGGYGPLTPKFGLGLDNLMSAEVVLSDGSRVLANSRVNQDLYWALRGGGGNFGVVTSMQIRLHRVQEVLSGKIRFSWSQAADVLQEYAALMSTAPDELSLTVAMESDADGKPLLVLVPHWCGDEGEGWKTIERLKGFGKPLETDVRRTPASNVISLFEPCAQRGLRYAQGVRWLAKVDERAISSLVDVADARTSPLSMVGLLSFHGAPSRVPLKSTAFGLRERHYLVSMVAAWDRDREDQDDVHRSWTREGVDAFAGVSLSGGYPSLLGVGEQDKARSAYGRNKDALLGIKRRFDPANVFEASTLPV
jgi:FAD/FMN-containing dehydrogenase